MTTVNFAERLLGDPDWVGKLSFFYYDGDGEARSKIIPFYENPDISETQSSRYNTMGTIGRAGNTFAYTGSDSRKINLNFSLTLPHILSTSVNRSVNDSVVTTVTQQKKEIEGAGAALQTPPTDPGKASQDARALLDHYRKVLSEKDEGGAGLLLNAPTAIEGGPLGLFTNAVVQETKLLRMAQVLDIIMDHVLTIRSSVLNNSRTPQNGPPIVRLSWGIMYQDVPCVVHNYSIKVNDKAGYDLETLLPRKIDVSMQLQEARNYGEFDRASEVYKDSLAGWEVILDSLNPTNNDPGYRF